MSNNQEGNSYERYGKDFVAARKIMSETLLRAKRDIEHALASVVEGLDGLRVCKGGIATSQGLMLYRWVKLAYDSGNIKRSYLIALSRQDIDIETGNLHERFGEIQFIRSSGEEVHTTYEHEVVRKGEHPQCTLVYRTQDAYPPVAKVGSSKPWGLDVEWEGDMPLLDCAHESFNAADVAKFFVVLVKADVGQGGRG